MPRRFFFLIALVAWCAPWLAAEDNWPCFRGPSGQGVSDAKNLPIEVGDKQNVKWKTPIHGKAWSSPVIWKDQVWLSSATADGKELSALCVDKATGKVLVDEVLFNVAEPQFCIPFNSYGSPTPCIEEGRVYITFGSAGTACLDTRDGKVIWERTDLKCNHFRGAGSSPLLWKNRLIMNFDGSDFQYIIALDTANGQTVWKTNRSIDFKDLDKNGKPRGDGDFRKAFSTPRLIDVDGKPNVVSVGSHAIYCYDALTGKELWRTEYRDGHSGSLTPVFGEGLVFATTGNGASEIWAIRPGGQGVVNDTNVVWRLKKKVPTRSSPVLVDGRLYMVSDAGIVSCVDAKTGKEIFSGRIASGHDAGYSASPLAANGVVYFFNEAGHETAIAIGDQFKILAEGDLDSGVMGCPAVSGDSLYVRTRTSLYRFDK